VEEQSNVQTHPSSDDQQQPDQDNGHQDGPLGVSIPNEIITNDFDPPLSIGARVLACRLKCVRMVNHCGRSLHIDAACLAAWSIQLIWTVNGRWPNLNVTSSKRRR
jgi:hypothetical protein